MDEITRIRSAVRGDWLLRTAAIWLTMLGIAHARPGARPPAEAPRYAMEANFLLNFTRFVEWPSDAFANPTAPFVICILGDDPFGGVLHRLMKGERVAAHKVVERHIWHDPPPRACQIIYVSASGKNVPAILHGISHGVLTVGDSQSFCREGGIIQFAIEDRHVRFDINRVAAANAGLTLSARLMSVARSVR